MQYQNETVTLNRGDYTTCTINLHGATVTSWRFEDEELLFVSRQSKFSGLLQVRGGMAFVFPHFGMWFFGPQHGFGRNLRWNLEEGPAVLKDSGDVYATFSLRSSAYTDSMWNFKFDITYRVTLCEKEIKFEVFIENSSKHFPFEFSILQHSLFKVPDVTKCSLIGFKNIMYRDETTGTKDMDPVILAPSMKDLKLEIGKHYEKDINVWNPWAEMSKSIHDL
ncbi:hypothetical protein NQ318_013682, partial [Aromia moschata]